MVGFPGETRDSVLKTAEFACSLPIDYASFNITVHRFGTPFRKNAVDLGYIDPLVLETESSESPTVCIKNTLSDKEILLLKKRLL